VIPVLLGLASSFGYGVSDYFASQASRRFSPVLLVAYSQFIQAVAVLSILVVFQEGLDISSVAWGAAGGILNATALIAYYEGLGLGPAAVVAPVAATGAALPVVVSVATGDSLPPVVLAGLGVILIGIVVVLSSKDDDEECATPSCRGAMAPGREATQTDTSPAERPSRASLFLAIFAAGSFGSFFLLVDQGSATSGSGEALWTAEGVQLGSLATTAFVALIRRTPWTAPSSAVVKPLAALTVLNLLGDLALVHGVGRGDVAIVGVLISLAPVITIVLALTLTSERPTVRQGLGGSLAVLGTLVVSAAQ
jgi:drug/metabolite transporter (DMT)-like permease